MAEKKKNSGFTGFSIFFKGRNETMKEAFKKRGKRGISFFHAKNKKDFDKKKKAILSGK